MTPNMSVILPDGFRTASIHNFSATDISSLLLTGDVRFSFITHLFSYRRYSNWWTFLTSLYNHNIWRRALFPIHIFFVFLYSFFFFFFFFFYYSFFFSFFFFFFQSFIWSSSGISVFSLSFLPSSVTNNIIAKTICCHHFCIVFLLSSFR